MSPQLPAAGMATTTVWFGLTLVVLGVAGFVGSGAGSPRTLLPSLIGVVLSGLGRAGQQDSRRTRTMHLAVVVAVVGLFGSVWKIADLSDLVDGEGLDRPWVVIVQSTMTVVLLVYVILAVRSFLGVRKLHSNS